ncbi:MAG: CRTAC1 family protein [Deltaproteobacteria bacterium]|nr:CRTAC1 family protein [Deltaproteobacteria bacterium]
MRTSTGYVGLALALGGLACAPSGPQATAETWRHRINPEADGLPGFMDITARAGVSFVHRPTEVSGPTAHWLYSATAGIVVADLDRDGQPDLFLPQADGPNGLFWGRADGTFVEADVPRDLGMPDHISSAASAVDYDGDGLLDLSLMALGELRLYRNLGDRTFVDVSAETGLRGDRGIGAAMAWADIDGDGDLDLWAGRHLALSPDGEPPSAAPDTLWRNDGGGFVDVTSALGLGEGDGAALHGVWKDLDGDGDLDLLQINDFGVELGNSHLFENQGDWTFVDRTAGSGVGVLAYPMGAAVRDLDGDGLHDLWISDIGRTTVLRGMGPFSFVDASASWAASLPTDSSATSWSVIDLDLDGDGAVDIFEAFSPLPPFEEGAPPDSPQEDVMWRQARDEGVQFERLDGLPPRLQQDTARGVGMADIDRNGTPDLVVAQAGAGPIVLLGRDTGASRLVVELQDTTGANRFGVGAQVQVQVGDVVQSDTLVAGGRGTMSGSEPALFFGLGDAERVDSIAVRWPDGTEDVLGPLCADCRVVIRR